MRALLLTVTIPGEDSGPQRALLTVHREDEMLHVIVGSGAVGGAVADLLADAGHTVRVVTRSGSGPSATASSGWPPTPPTPSGSPR